MSNDPRDDAMREIEAALEILIDRAAVGRGVADQRVKVLALIRSKLPQPDAGLLDAAGDLLRAAKAAVDYRTARTVDQVELVLNCLRIQIAKAERAGIKP